MWCLDFRVLMGSTLHVHVHACYMYMFTWYLVMYGCVSFVAFYYSKIAECILNPIITEMLSVIFAICP